MKTAIEDMKSYVNGTNQPVTLNDIAHEFDAIRYNEIVISLVNRDLTKHPTNPIIKIRPLKS